MKKVKHLRKCLRIIRDIHTLPSTILPNGKSAELTAHIYVLSGNKKRNQQKRKREQKNVICPINSTEKNYSDELFHSSCSTKDNGKKRSRGRIQNKSKRRRKD